MRAKVLVLAMLLAALPLPADQVRITSFGELARTDAADLLKTQGNPGVHTFRELIDISAKELTTFAPLSEDGQMDLDTFKQLIGLRSELAEDISSEMLVTSGTQTFRLLWPQKLLSIYKDKCRASATQCHVLMANGLLSDFSRIHTLVVFHVMEKSPVPE